MLQDMQIIVPKLVLDEECHHRMDCTQETAGIRDGIEWQVGNDISTFIVLADLIAGRREESEQDLVFRMLLAQLLHQGPSLLELSQRGCMEPDVLGTGIHFLAQDLECLALASPHFPHLLVEAAIDSNSKKIQIYNQVVYHQPNTSIARFILAIVSSLPKKAEISNMPGPLPSPTSVKRQAFITLPSLYSFCSTHAWTICS